MRPAVLQAVCLLWMGLFPSLLSAGEVAVVKTEPASQAALAAARAGREVYLATLTAGDKGELFAGEVASLPAGRYRLHALVAAAPLGNLVVGLVQIEMTAGRTARRFSMVHLPRDDEFTPLALAFEHAGGPLPVRLRWLVEEDQKTTGLKGKRELEIFKLQDKDGGAEAAGRGALEVGDDEDMGLELEEGGGTLTLAEARKTRYRLVAAGVHVQALSPVAIRVRTDKICYEPGEKAEVRILFTNTTQRPVQVRPEASLHWRLAESRVLPCEPFSLPAGGRLSTTLAFPTDDLYWGAEVVVRARAAGQPDSAARTIFAVRRNIWETAITGAHPGHLGLFDEPQDAARAAEELRDAGYNGFEAFFWGPCDMLEYTPERERWASGQTAYPGSITGTKNLIAACHKRGIFATLYANLWGGSGPPALEVQRRHPEWFGNANYNTFVLDDWELLGPWQDMREARLRAPGVLAWCFNQLTLDPPLGVFQRHADELIGTHRQFGWDGVRYDSHYSRYWSVKAMREVRHRVEAKAPSFQFGYNAFVGRDYQALALDTAIGGGGMIMAEGIRIERRQHLTKFAEEVLRWRDPIWAYGGHGPGMLFRNGHDEDTMPPLGIEYQAAIILAAGGHLYYDPPASERAHYPHFALRYSEYIYNNRMRALAAPEDVVSFGTGAEFLAWQTFARTLSLDGTKRRLVLHLINPPVRENPWSNKAMAAPPPQRQVPVTLRLPSDAAVTGAWCLGASPDAWHREVAASTRGGATTLIVPEVRFWTVLVVEYDAPQGLAEAVTAKDKTDSLLQHWQVMGPFASDRDFAGFAAVHPPEKGFDPGMAVPGAAGRPLRWQRVGAGAPPLGHWRIDFNRILDWDRSAAMAYAYTTIHSTADRAVLLCAAHDDALRIWLNGERVHDGEKKAGEFAIDQVKVPVRLRQGKNEILVKSCTKWADWTFALRVADPQGRPWREGVTYGLE